MRAAEGAYHRPAAGAAHGGGVRSRLVGGVETVDGVIGQQEPPGGEVVRRVARAKVAEVDHAAEGAFGGEDVGRV
jgi:hypothetical protein